MLQTVNIYDLYGNLITSGLQSSTVCDEAIQTARRLASHRGKSVIVEDVPAEQCYRITPAGDRKRAPNGWTPEWEVSEDE